MGKTAERGGNWANNRFGFRRFLIVYSRIGAAGRALAPILLGALSRKLKNAQMGVFEFVAHPEGLFALLTTRKTRTAHCLFSSTIVSNPLVGFVSLLFQQ